MSLTLNIPESLDEITLAQYQKWVKISEDKDMSTFLQQKMIEIFCNTDLRKVNQMKANDINRVSKELDDLFIEDDKKAIDSYKSEYKEYWSQIFDQVGEEVDFSIEEGDTIEAPVEYADQ